MIRVREIIAYLKQPVSPRLTALHLIACRAGLAGLVGMMLSLLLLPVTGRAADLGVHGTVWPIAEPDLLQQITAELGRAETDGRLAAFNNQVEGQVKSAFTAPPALALTRTTRPASRLFDPSITAHENIYTHTGQLIVAAGTVVNPLHHLPLTTPLVFIDGRDADQMAFALSWPQPAMLILTGGNPQQLMKAHGRRLFYDQKGVLSRRFRLTAVPSVITQQDDRLRITEFVPPAHTPERNP